MSTSKKSVTIKAFFLQEQALLILLGVRHVNQVLNLLIANNVSGIDPTIGDASCEQRVGFLLDTLAKVQAFLNTPTKKSQALSLVKAYDEAHKRDKADTQVRTVEDAKGAANPTGYDDLIDALKKHLGDAIVTYAGLCYTFTVASILSTDEFRSPFSYRAKNFFATSTPKAEETKKQNDLNNQEAAYRTKLAELSIPYFERKIEELPCDDRYQITIGDRPTRRYFVEEQLREADRFMNSVIIAKDGSRLPVKPIYNQMRAIGLQEFNAGRSIIIVVRRIELHRVDDEPVPTEEQEEEEDDTLQYEFGEPEASSNLSYTLGTARALLFKPNPATGHFEFVANPTSAEKETPYLFIDAWSSYFDDTDRTGLDAADHDEYFTALAQADPWWLVMQYSAGHPPYTGNAKDSTPHHHILYDQCCQPQAIALEYGREHCEGFDLNKNIANQRRPNLSNEYRMAALMAASRNLTSCQEVKMGEPGSSFLRIKRPVDFQIDHIHAMSLAQAIAGCADLIAFHEKVAAAGAVIGPFVVRMGERGVSCTDHDDANVLMGTKNENSKKRDYLKKYPKNDVLLTA